MSRKNEITEKIDKFVGVQIQEIRVAKGWSRMQLADKIGLTGQQLHKYEKGTNRVSCGRIYTIARVFKKPVSYFFPEINEENLDVDELQTKNQRMNLELCRNFQNIKNPDMKTAINDFVRIAGKAEVKDNDE